MFARCLLAVLLLCGAVPGVAQSPFDCSASEEHRQFDFWIGTWSVRDAEGKLRGTNEISAVQNGCALEEHWTSASGGSGQSINYYHPGRGVWHQLWNDGGASIIDISGGLREGAMVLEGSIYYLQKAVEKPFRGVWTQLEDGRVKQRFEEKDESGEWQLWFEGLYTRE